MRCFRCCHISYTAIACLVFALIAICMSVQPAFGQTAQFTQGTSGSNTVGMKVPLTSYPGRGQNLPVTLYYSSKVWRMGFMKTIAYSSTGKQSVAEAIYSEFSTAGWTTSLDVPRIQWPRQNDVYWSDGKPYAHGTLFPNTYRVARVHIHMPDGSVHELRKSDQVYQDTGAVDMVGTFYAVDSSRMRYDSTGASSGTLYLPDGTRYVMNGSTTQCIDRNGNTLSFDHVSRQWTDTMGRTVGMPWPVNPTAGDHNYVIPGFGPNGTISYTLRFKNLSDALSPGSLALQPIGDYYLPNPNQEPGDYNSSNFPQPTNMASMFASGHTGVEELPSTLTRVIGRGQVGTNVFNPVVLTEIIYPNGQSYKFFYNSFGEIDKVVQPTGAYERYLHITVPAFEHQGVPYYQGTRGIFRKWLSANGTGTDELEWQYLAQWTPPGNYMITVIAPAPDGRKQETLLYGSLSSKFGYDSTGKRGLAYEERIYASPSQGGALLRRTLKDWDVSDASNNMPAGTGQYVAFRNPRLIRSTSIMLDTGQANALAASTSFDYDETYAFSVGVEKTLTTEYMFTTIPQSTAQDQPLTAISLGTLLRTTQNAYLTDNANYRSRNILGFPTSSIVRDAGSNIVAQGAINYDEVAYPLLAYGVVPNWTDPQTVFRGNPTTFRRWLDFPTSTWIESHTQFDQCGSVRNLWDANNNQSQIEYAETYKFAYPTTHTSAAPDSSGTHGQPTGLVRTSIYDSNTGLLTSSTDPNGRVTTFEYNDSLRRLTKVTLPDGGWTSTSYNDVPGNTFVRTQVLQRTTPSQQVTESYQYFDKLGRAVRSFVNEGSTYITRDTQYDSLGRTWRVSNPYRTNSLTDPVNPGNQWTTNTFDAFHRPLTVTTPDGAHSDKAYGYSLTGVLGTTVTVFDQNGRSRKLVSDAHGRLVKAVEDAAGGGLNYQSNYTYDVLDNLRQVEQGSQLRYFGYDSLGRVIRTRHVEQNINTSLAWTDPVTGYSGWTTGISYDAVGNILTKTDARNVVTTFQYDRLRRIKTVRYTNDPQNTPGIDNYYDGYRGNVNNNIADSKGHLWQSETLGQVRFTTDSFDVVGRPKVQKQQFWTGSWGTVYLTNLTYDLAGAVLTQSYPSGRSVSYDYDLAGRLINFSGNLGGGPPRTYASQFQYNEWGALQQEQFGTQTALYHKQRHNVRGQLWDVRLSTVSFSSNPADGDRGSIVNFYSTNYTQGGSGADNNGNLLRQEINVPSSNSFQQNYTYDSLNRLTTVSEKLNGAGADSFKQVFDYDRWGNRTVNFAQSSSNVPRPTYTADPNTNRLVAPSGFTYGYDSAGNQTSDNYTGNGQRDYDAENRMLAAQGTGGAWQNYKYSGSGLRVRRIVGGQETWQVYGFGGQLIAEYAANGPTSNPQREYGYRNDQLLITADSTGGGGGGLTAQNVTWTNGVGVSISGNNVTRTQAGDGWNAGAVSSQTIASGDGYVEITVSEMNKARSFGLTTNTSVTSFQFISYGMVLGDNNLIAIHEGIGVYGNFGSYTTGDVLRVSIEGGVVKFRKNGTLLRTSSVAPTYPLRAGAAVFTSGSTVTNAILSSGSGGSSGSAVLRWLVTDHLGTPRMTVDDSGNLAGVTRHDYLPFGEEIGSTLVSLIGGRQTTPGYVAPMTRQRFTGYEHDLETGLNFAEARYQSPAQGRFTSVDPFTPSGSLSSPQSFNRYAYVENNPSNLTDPTGLIPFRGADQSMTDVSVGFWGTSFDFSTPHPFRGQYIIAAHLAVQSMLLELHLAASLVQRYIDNGNYLAAATLVARNPGLGIDVNGTQLWGELAGVFLGGMDEGVKNTRLAGIGIGGLDLIRRGWQAVARKLSQIRGPDFVTICAVIGVGTCYSVARDDGLDGLMNPMIGYVGSFNSKFNGPGAELSLAFGWMGQFSQPTNQEIRNWLTGTSWTISGFYKLGGGFVFSGSSPYFAVLGGFGIGGKAFTEAHTNSKDGWVNSVRRFFNF